MQQCAKLTAAGYRAVRCPRVCWLYNARLVSGSALVEGGQLQAESFVIRIKLADLSAKQFDLGIHDIRQGPSPGTLSRRIIGNVLLRPARVRRCTCLSYWRSGRPGTFS